MASQYNGPNPVEFKISGQNGAVVPYSFYDQLWRRTIPTPLKEGEEYLQQFAFA